MFSCKKNSTENAQNIADYAITQVTLIDGTGKEAVPGATILIKDEKILAIVNVSTEIMADSIINGKGKYVIPGLFDNHIHLGNDETKFQRQMDQLIHFGVTTILVPGADNQKLLRYKSANKEKGLQAPNIYHTSLMTTMKGKHPAKTYGDSIYFDGININYIKDESSIGPIVKQAVEDKAIAVKLMIEDGPMPPFVKRIPEDYVALMSEKAHESGLDLFAHVSDKTEAEIAVNNDADAIMHFFPLDWEKDTAIIQKIIDKNISLVSTAMLAKSFFYPINREWFENENYAVFDSDQKEAFNDSDGSKEAESRAILKMITRSENPKLDMIIPLFDNLKKFYDRGTNVVLGTDVRGRPYIFPGHRVHEEMELFQMAGFKPEQIIQCASLNSARMLKIDESYGSVEPGKYADLILLDRNPLENINNTLSINTVFKQGKIQNRITNANNGYK